MTLHDQSSMPLSKILRRPFRHREGNCWIADAFELRRASDLPGFDRSSLMLYEDDVAMGPRHVDYHSVGKIGRGAFSHWGSDVLFSSSDNTDPNSNGREYKAVVATFPEWKPLSDSGCHVCCKQLSVFDEFLKVDVEIFAEEDSIADCELILNGWGSHAQSVSSRRANLLSFFFGARSRSDSLGKGLRVLEKLRLPHVEILGQLFDGWSGHFMRMVFVARFGAPQDMHKTPSERARDAMEMVDKGKIQVRLQRGQVVEFNLFKLAESHWSYRDEAFLQLGELIRDKKSGVFLEIGGRGLDSTGVRKWVGNDWQYLALDIKPGRNVDIVGDVHTMSTQLGKASVDVVYSVSVFEHLYMPWRAVLEIGAVLKMGGLCYVHTPYFWPVHEAPWDFFRSSKFAWSALFNSHTGFEVLKTGDLGVSRPVAQVANRLAVEASFGTGPQATMVLAKKVSDSSLRWDSYNQTIVPGMYPD